MKFLIIHTWGIGDWLMFLPSLRDLLARTADVTVDLALGRHGLEPLVPRDSRVCIVEEFDARSLSVVGALKLCMRLKRQNYDTVIFTGTARWIVAAISGLLLFPRVLAQTNPGLPLIRAKAFVQLDGEPRFEAHRRLMASAIGVTELLPTPGRAPASGQAEPLYFIRRVGLHLGSEPRMPFKRWPLQHWFQLAAKIAPTAEITFIVGPDESSFAQAAAATGLGRVVKPQDLNALMTVLTEVDVVLCADSGVGHVAAHVGTPVVSLYGPADPAEVQPWSASRVVTIRSTTPPSCSPCIRRGGGKGCLEQPCMTSISVDQVFEALQRRLCRQ